MLKYLPPRFWYSVAAFFVVCLVMLKKHSQLNRTHAIAKRAEEIPVRITQSALQKNQLQNPPTRLTQVDQWKEQMELWFEMKKLQREWKLYQASWVAKRQALIQLRVDLRADYFPDLSDEEIISRWGMISESEDWHEMQQKFQAESLSIEQKYVEDLKHLLGTHWKEFLTQAESLIQSPQVIQENQGKESMPLSFVL
jgi:hypothetical protein